MTVSEEIYTLPDDTGELARRIADKIAGKRSKPKISKSTEAVEIFAQQCRERGLPVFLREYEFAKYVGKKWRFDFAWVLPSRQDRPTFKLAVEIEGIVMRMTKSREWVMGGRHGTISGFKEDCLKYATAASLGWRLMRFEQTQVRDNVAISHVMRALARNGWRPK